jgi:hypothetical protein
MTRLRLRQRWLPVPYGVFGVVLALLFGSIAVYSWYYTDDEPTVLVVLPLFGVSLYMVAAAACNIYTAVITPKRVWEYVFPFPIRLPRQLPREKIRCCYLRNVVIADNGTELESHYYAGVESLAGRQIDASGPHKTEEEALVVAHRIASVLNQEPGREPLAIVAVEQIRTRAEAIRIIGIGLCWLVVSVAAIFLGVMWDSSFTKRRRDSVKR